MDHAAMEQSRVGLTRAPGAVLRDLVALTKPRITLMVCITTYGGLWLAQRAVGPVPMSTALWTLLGVGLIVAGANALNMYWERDIDGRMDRTKNRPLPSGRLTPRWALLLGTGLSLVALPILALSVNLVTALLASLANLLYVFAYTPMKQRSYYALHVGAVPGAIPPLLGWTAATGRVEPAAVALFGILFFWQLPHFHAIALFRSRDYANAGLVVMPNVAGIEATKTSIVWTTFGLVVASLVLVPLGVVGKVYLTVAMVAGATIFAGACAGLRPGAGPRWAKRFFAGTLVYLLVLFAGIVADA